MEFLFGHNSFIPYKMIFTMVFKWKSNHCSDHFDLEDEVVEPVFTVVPGNVITWNDILPATC